MKRYGYENPNNSHNCQDENHDEIELYQQSGRSPKVVALFSATNFSNFIL